MSPRVFLDKIASHKQAALLAACVFAGKLLLSALFSSDYPDRMFIPFIEGFLTSGGNPYEAAWAAGNTNAFPYPPMMLYLNFAGTAFIRLVESAPVTLRNLFFKLPSLFFDLMAFAYLLRLTAPPRRRWILLYYFASPILLFAVYMHGQLDVIPTALLLAALYHITRHERWHLALGTAFLAVAIGCKLHILSVLPLVFLYLLKRRGIWAALCAALTPVAVAALLILPYWGEAFLRMVLLNPEQSQLILSYLPIGGLNVYLPLMAAFAVYLMCFSLRLLGRDLLMAFNGALFALFVTLVPPMPGWYIWVVPFFALFFSQPMQDTRRGLSLFLLINALYLVYFLFFHDTGVTDLSWLGRGLSLKVDSVFLRNCAFTALSSLMGAVVILYYRFNRRAYQRKNLAFSIGIAGDSGAGKSRLLDTVYHLLGRRHTLTMEGDGDHRWERGHEMWQTYTHLNPKANFLYRQAEDILNLRRGTPVKRVEYSHADGKLTAGRTVWPQKYIILCGLHSLYLPKLRDTLDLKIFVDTSEKLRVYWKVVRDVHERGYDMERVLEQIHTRQRDAEQYIRPQKEYADLLIHYDDDTLEEGDYTPGERRLCVSIRLSADIDLGSTMTAFAEWGIGFRQEYSGDLRWQTVFFSGGDAVPPVSRMNALAREILPALDDFIYAEIAWQAGLDGLLQLILLVLIDHRLKEAEYATGDSV